MLMSLFKKLLSLLGLPKSQKPKLLDPAALRLDYGGGVQLTLAGGRMVTLLGGPYVNIPPGVAGIRLEQSVHKPYMIDFPIRDFGVPMVEDMEQAMIGMIRLIDQGHDTIYVGCKGGIGRTGMFIGCAVRVMQDSGYLDESLDPVQLVRQTYLNYAIETPAQEKFVRGFNAGNVIAAV